MTKYPTVLGMDCDTCLLKLKMLNAQAAYQRRYQEITNQKREQ